MSNLLSLCLCGSSSGMTNPPLINGREMLVYQPQESPPCHPKPLFQYDGPSLSRPSSACHLGLHIPNCYLDIINNRIIGLINKISDSSINSNSFMSDTTECANLLSHLPLVRTSRGYSPHSNMRILYDICPCTSPCCNSVMLPRSNYPVQSSRSYCKKTKNYEIQDFFKIWKSTWLSRFFQKIRLTISRLSCTICF